MSSSPNHSPSKQQSFLGRGPQRLAEPEKELRFTRTRQAAQFFVLTAVLAMVSLGTFSAMFSKWGPNDPDFEQFCWLALIPLPFAALTLRFAIRCIRHAYILLSPLGVEIFPFFKPEKNLQIIFWAEIHAAEFHPSSPLLTLHTDANHTSGIVATLAPISPTHRQLLKAALDKRLAPVNDK